MSDLNSLLPKSVSVVFPCASDSVLTASNFVIEVEFENGREGDSRPLHSGALASMPASGDDAPTNEGELESLAEQLASDWYAWQLGDLHVRFPGNVPVVPEGHHEIEWTVREGDCGTLIRRSPMDWPYLDHYGSAGAGAKKVIDEPVVYNEPVVHYGTVQIMDVLNVGTTSTIGIVNIYGFSKVNYYDSSYTKFYDNSTTTYNDYTKVEFTDWSKLNLFKYTQINIYGSSYVSFGKDTIVDYLQTVENNYWDNSKTNYYDYTAITYNGGVTIKHCDQTAVTYGDNTTVTFKGNSSLVMTENSTITFPTSATSTNLTVTSTFTSPSITNTATATTITTPTTLTSSITIGTYWTLTEGTAISITTNTDDLTIPTTSLVKVTTSGGSYNLTSIVKPVGSVATTIKLIKTDTGTLTITNNSGGTADNRLINVTGADIPLTQYTGVEITYVTSLNRWVAVPLQGNGGSITGSGTTNVMSRFTGASTIGDSAVTDDGLTVTSTRPYVAPAATTSIPSIRLPPGTAPTSPTNGDLWTTTGGIYARVNGVTKQLDSSGVAIGDAIGSSSNYYLLSIDGSGQLSQINPSTSGYVLTSNGAGAAATFQAVTATPGGSSGDVQVKVSPDGGFGGVSPGTSGNVLKSNGSAWTSAAPATLAIGDAIGGVPSSEGILYSNSSNDLGFISPVTDGHVMKVNGGSWIAGSNSPSADNVLYTAGNAADWAASTPPTTLSAALDRIAAAFAANALTLP